jgi:RHH-type proline utilization regulon transcriptional repressor/proline dehydrogenase/delta 1-pyrroline-5-carboxylate dehydrogenase
MAAAPEVVSNISSTALRQAIRAAHRRNEAECVAWMQSENSGSHGSTGSLIQTELAKNEPAIQALAKTWVQQLRRNRLHTAGVDALMQQFPLSSKEGLALMQMAEALLRIPDSATADKLISDVLKRGEWRHHCGQSPSLFVNVTSFGLFLADRILDVCTHADGRTKNGLIFSVYSAISY